MVQKGSSGIYASTVLSSCRGVRHGFSSRAWGDMREKGNRDKLLGRAGFASDRLVWQKQVHGIGVRRVNATHCGMTIPDSDALVYTPVPSDNGTRPVLAVHAADCVPLLVVEPVAKILGVAHAGWKGTLSALSRRLVRRMAQLGARPERLYVSIGPHIGACCYCVDPNRIRQFLEADIRNDQAVEKRHGRWYLDLAGVTAMQLIREGIPADHIDSTALCTSCHVREFYSFRKDSRGSYGEIMGFIGFPA